MKTCPVMLPFGQSVTDTGSRMRRFRCVETRQLPNSGGMHQAPTKHLTSVYSDVLPQMGRALSAGSTPASDDDASGPKDGSAVANDGLIGPGETDE